MIVPTYVKLCIVFMRSLRGAYADETVAYADESVYTICLLICRCIGGCATFSCTDISSPAFGGTGRFVPQLLSVLGKVVQPPMRLQIKRQTVDRATRQLVDAETGQLGDNRRPRRSLLLRTLGAGPRSIPTYKLQRWLRNNTSTSKTSPY